MKNEQPGYSAYLLRLWYEEGAVCWRAMLENVHTGEQTGFANMEKLFAYLKQQAQAILPENAPNAPQSERKEKTDV